MHVVIYSTVQFDTETNISYRERRKDNDDEVHSQAVCMISSLIFSGMLFGRLGSAVATAWTRAQVAPNLIPIPIEVFLS